MRIHVQAPNILIFRRWIIGVVSFILLHCCAFYSILYACMRGRGHSHTRKQSHTMCYSYTYTYIHFHIQIHIQLNILCVIHIRMHMLCVIHMMCPIRRRKTKQNLTFTSRCRIRMPVDRRTIVYTTDRIRPDKTVPWRTGDETFWSPAIVTRSNKLPLCWQRILTASTY